MSTDQIRHWRGEFGDGYVARNEATEERVRNAVAMWSTILRAVVGEPPASVLEVGANIGINLRALACLTGAELHAVEPNAAARERLVADRVLAAERVRDGMAHALPHADASVDLVFTSGVLIHVHPDDLPAACAEIHRVARRYVLAIEYFSHQPEALPYRGEEGQLFKRDFGRFWMERHPDLALVDYGFFWQVVYGVDNLHWWLFRKGG